MKLNFHQLLQFLYLFSNSKQTFTMSSVVQQLSSAPHLDNYQIWVIANPEGSIPRHSCRNHHSACLPLNQRIMYLLCAMYYASDIMMPGFHWFGKATWSMLITIILVDWMWYTEKVTYAIETECQMSNHCLYPLALLFLVS